MIGVNYLAHLYLAGADSDLLLGAMLGDFAKGRLENLPYSPGVLGGVRLHREIDSFTDAHPRTLISRRRFSPARRRYAGIIVDLAYDHFLARHWGCFSPLPLAEFTDEAYRQLLARRERLPPTLQRVLPRMAAQDWLGSYAELDTVGRALERIGGRFRRGNPLLGVLTELESAYLGLEEDFLAFFPELAAFARARRLGPLAPAKPAPTLNGHLIFTEATVPDRVKPKPPRMSPGDQGPPGTPGTGENICPRCSGSGRLGERSCPHCSGTGLIVQGIGGA